MIKTNQDRLVEMSVCGVIAPARVPHLPGMTTAYDGSSFLPVGAGGITRNVRIGDPAFGWAWGDHVEPGVSLCGEAADDGALMALSCIGNEALLVRGEQEPRDAKLKGAGGVVVGKRG